MPELDIWPKKYCFQQLKRVFSTALMFVCLFVISPIDGLTGASMPCGLGTHHGNFHCSLPGGVRVHHRIMVYSGPVSRNTQSRE